MRIVIHGLAPFHRDYSHLLEAHKKGQFSMLQWNAERSAGKWCHYVQETLALLHDNRWSQWLDLTPSGPEALPFEEHQVENGRVQKLWSFLVELASNRCWSQLAFNVLFPYSLAQCYLPSADARRDAGRTMARMCAAIRQAEAEAARIA